MGGIVAYASYVPASRLDRQRIRDSLGHGTGGSGSRAVASYDEDAASMAVEAARRALRLTGESPRRLLFSTTSPPYLDKTNAALLHAALALNSDVQAFDMVGSVASGAGALLIGAESTFSTLVALADIRYGLPGSADELEGGDGAACFIFGEEAPIVEVLASASVTQEFLDRWRSPGNAISRVWEERFGESVYVPLGSQALEQALYFAEIPAGKIDELLVAGTHTRANRSFATASGLKHSADPLVRHIGNAGTAHAGLLLANALDGAIPGQHIALVVLADGATAMILRVTDALSRVAQSVTVSEQIAKGDQGLRYTDFLTWRGILPRESVRRPLPVPPAAPPTLRGSPYKHAFQGSRCVATSNTAVVCGTVHIPPSRVCARCKTADEMVLQPMADEVGTISTFTIDHLAYSPSPPVIAVVVDFDCGGRLTCELTDARPSEISVGQRVEPTFRRLTTAGEVHNYFWKVQPVR